MYTYIHMHTRPHIHTYTRTHAHTPSHTHVHTYTHKYGSSNSYRTSYTGHMVHLTLYNQLTYFMCVVYRQFIFCIYIFDVEIEETISVTRYARAHTLYRIPFVKISLNAEV